MTGIPVVLIVAMSAPGVLSWLRRRRTRRRLSSPTDRAAFDGPPGRYRLLGDRRDVRRLAADLPLLAEAVARDLRAGATVAGALVEAGDGIGGVLASDMAAVERELGAGTSLVDALQAWRDRRSTPALDQFVATAILGAELGGRAAPSFDATAASLRDQAEVAAEVRSLTAQSRASAGLLTGLPPVAACGLALLEPATGTFLFGTTAGRLDLGGALLLVVVGWWWMGRLCRFDR